MYSAQMDLGNPSAALWYREILMHFHMKRISFVLNSNDLSFLNVRSPHLDYLPAEIHNILLNGHVSAIETFGAERWR